MGSSAIEPVGVTLKDRERGTTGIAGIVNDDARKKQDI